MPQDNKTNTADTRDEQIKILEEKVANLQKENDLLAKDVEKAKEKLKAAKSAPTGDVVYLGGQSYPVVSTHRANTTFDEVKKGYLEEGLTLVAINKVH